MLLSFSPSFWKASNSLGRTLRKLLYNTGSCSERRHAAIRCCTGEASTSGREAQSTEHSMGRRSALFGAASLLALLPALSAKAAPKAAPKLQNVVDGGVTELVSSSVIGSLSSAEKKSLEINKRIQRQNNAPVDFPAFVRDGFDIKIMADDYERDNKGLIYKDFEQGTGPQPEDGQQVTFDYTAYNENGNRIDSSYKQGRPAQTRLGINGLIPGFELGIKGMKPGVKRSRVVPSVLGLHAGASTFFSAKQYAVHDVQLQVFSDDRVPLHAGFELGIKGMKPGGKRRIVVPPELGPPVGPSTFFSAKQCEVFDVQLVDVKSCRRRQVAMFSDVICE